MRIFQAAIGKYEEHLTLVKKRKLRWFGHISWSSGLVKTILQSTVQGKIRTGGKTILRNGQGWTLLAQLGQLMTGLCGKGLLEIHLCAPTTLQGYGID